jgi:hypothetical protein
MAPGIKSVSNVEEKFSRLQVFDNIVSKNFKAHDRRIIQSGCFVFTPYDATPLPETDITRRGFSGNSVIGDPHVQAENDLQCSRWYSTH